MPYMELIKTESGVMDVQPVGKSLKVIPSNRWRTPNLHMNCKEWLDNPQNKNTRIWQEKLRQNCPINTHDITCVKSICGTELETIRGETVRNKPIRVDTEEYTKITEYFYKLHKFMTLISDIIFIIGNEIIIK